MVLFENSLKGFLAGFLRRKEILSKFSEYIGAFDFDSIQPGLNWLIESAVDFFKKYNVVPSREYWVSILNDVGVSGVRMSEERRGLLLRLVDELYALPEAEIGYRVDQFRDELVRRLLGSLHEIIDGKNKSNIVDRIKEISGVMSVVEGLYRERQEVIDFGSSFVERERRRELFLRERILKLGIKDLDEQVRMAYRTVTAFLAPFKRYKSITLTNVGWAALMQGFNVLHVNYEGRRELWEARYDARFADMDFDKVLYMRRSELDQARLEQVANMLARLPQRLFLVWGIPYTTGVDDIIALIKEIERERGLYIDVVVIDYFQIMGGAGRLGDEEDWLAQHKICWDVVRLANYGENGRIVVGALQTRMSAVTAASLRSDQFSRSSAYPQVFDNVIAINQSKDERAEGVIRFSPLVIRDGEIKKEHCKVEAELWKIKIAREMDKLLSLVPGSTGEAGEVGIADRGSVGIQGLEGGVDGK